MRHLKNFALFEIPADDLQSDSAVPREENPQLRLTAGRPVTLNGTVKAVPKLMPVG